MAQQQSSSAAHPSTTTLYPQLESSIAPLEEGQQYLEIINIEKDFIGYLKSTVSRGNPLDDVADTSILPSELIHSGTKKASKLKLDPLKRIKELSTNEEVEEEEEQEDEEDELLDEEVVEDEENAGGDYVVSHFDNGEGYDENDDEGDDMTSTI